MSATTQAMRGEVMEKTKARANEAKRAAMATKVATTQEQRPS
jgi:hypothetical protein